MPQYTYGERQILMAEAELWTALSILCAIEHDGHWSERLKIVKEAVHQLAKEFRDYNDQWEEE